MIAFYVNGRKFAIIDNALNVNSAFNLRNVMTAISYADTINLVTLSAFVGGTFAIVFGCIFKLFKFKDALKVFEYLYSFCFGCEILYQVQENGQCHFYLPA